MDMIAPSRFLVVEGPIDRILGSHRTTDVSITEHTSSRPGTAGAAHQTDTHAFVNTSREFAMLLEVKGRTLKLVSDDYIAAAEGDVVRALCEPTHNGPLVVKDWHNRTRSIRFRNVPRPLAGVAANIVWTVILLIAGVGTVLGFRQESHAFFPTLIGVALLAASALLAAATVQKASALAQAHAELDRLG
jgi:hypothetical protein